MTATLAILQQLADRLREARDINAVYRETLSAGMAISGSDRGAMLLAPVSPVHARGHASDAAALRVVATTDEAGLPQTLVITDPDSPLWRVADRGAPLVWSADDGSPPASFAGHPNWQWLLAVRLPLAGRARGVLVVGGGCAPLTEVRTGDLQLVASLFATAWDRTRLRAAMDRLAQVLGGAVATSAALVQATDPDTVRRRFLDGLTANMGLDGAVLWCPAEDDKDVLDLVAHSGLPPDVQRAVTRLPPTSVAARLLDGSLPDDPVTGLPPVASSSWRGLQVRLVRVPDPADGVLGVYARGEVPDLIDRVLATLAHALAAAVQQTTLHERARTVVDSLQRELRPRKAQLPDGATVGSVYRGATAGVDVGGDFFDVFVTESGHIGLACGDVAGKGVEAASLTAMAVYSLRAYALQGDAPQAVLAQLNRAVARQIASERFMTLAYARIDPTDWAVQHCVAGHPPPVLVGPGGAEVIDSKAGLPLGIAPASSYEETSWVLPPGHSLVLHTDGVTEARRGGHPGGELFGTAGLVQALEDLKAAPAQEMADGLWAAVQQWSDAGTTDDCAVIVLSRPGGFAIGA